MLGLSPAVLAAVRETGYTTPTTIQEKSIPIILMGKDVIGASPVSYTHLDVYKRQTTSFMPMRTQP